MALAHLVRNYLTALIERRYVTPQLRNFPPIGPREIAERPLRGPLRYACSHARDEPAVLPTSADRTFAPPLWDPSPSGPAMSAGHVLTLGQLIDGALGRRARDLDIRAEALSRDYLERLLADAPADLERKVTIAIELGDGRGFSMTLTGHDLDGRELASTEG